MKKTLPVSFLMACAGFLVGWHTAPPLFAGFVAAFFGFALVPDDGLWLRLYLRFAFGTAGLFAVPAWMPHVARNRAPFAPWIAIYLFIGIVGSVAAATVWHWMLCEDHRDWMLHAFLGRVRASDFPCLSIPFTGVVATG